MMAILFDVLAVYQRYAQGSVTGVSRIIETWLLLWAVSSEDTDMLCVFSLCAVGQHCSQSQAVCSAQFTITMETACSARSSSTLSFPRVPHQSGQNPSADQLENGSQPEM